jgi:hypothetical protein
MGDGPDRFRRLKVLKNCSAVCVGLCRLVSEALPCLVLILEAS